MYTMRHTFEPAKWLSRKTVHIQGEGLMFIALSLTGSISAHQIHMLLSSQHKCYPSRKDSRV